jgi:uncharacterized glyoxalase superfamily protein PhnB
MSAERRQTIFPALRYQDAHAAIDFFVRAFQFEKRAVFEGPDGTVAHAELQFGDAHVGLSSDTGPVAGNPWTTVPQGIYVVLPDPGAVRQHHARVVAAGGEVAVPVRDTDYGSTEYSVWDPGRHLWGFGTYTHATPGEPTLSVGLHYENGPQALKWVKEVFGFRENLLVPGTDGVIAHAELQFGSSILMMGSAPRDRARWGDQRQSVHIYLADPDAHFARAKAAGATIVDPPTDTPYGARAYYARDPGGFLWGFGTYRPESH